MIPRPPRSTLFPTRRSSDLIVLAIVLLRLFLLGLRCGLLFLLLYFYGCCRHLPSGEFARRRATSCQDRKSTRLNSSHSSISYAVFCLKKKKKNNNFINHNIT